MGMIFLFLALIIMTGGYFYVHEEYTFKNFATDFYANFGAELASIAITIIIVDRIIKAKAKDDSEAELKARLLQQLHSHVNSIANSAVHELRAIGKLVGKGAWTVGAKLGGKADLSSARLYDANFQNARLVGANFTEADLRNVNFSGSDLTGAIFEKAKISHAKFDTSTILPDGTVWTANTNMSKLGAIDFRSDVSWLKKINTSEVDINLSSIMALPVTAKNLLFYLNTVFKEEVVAKDELHFERHWVALERFGYSTIEEVDNLLKRTEEIRQWIWDSSPPPYKIVHISFAIAIENPEHLELPHWTKETKDKIEEGLRRFIDLDSL